MARYTAILIMADQENVVWSIERHISLKEKLCWVTLT